MKSGGGKETMGDNNVCEWGMLKVKALKSRIKISVITLTIFEFGYIDYSFMLVIVKMEIKMPFIS